MVKRALALVKSVGLARASGALHAPGMGFVDGDKFLRDAWAVAEASDGHSGGWIEYGIVNPGSGDVMPKTSYIVRLERDLFIGCGVYRRADAASSEVAKTPAATATAAALSPGR